MNALSELTIFYNGTWYSRCDGERLLFEINYEMNRNSQVKVTRTVSQLHREDQVSSQKIVNSL